MQLPVLVEQHLWILGLEDLGHELQVAHGVPPVRFRPLVPLAIPEETRCDVNLIFDLIKLDEVQHTLLEIWCRGEDTGDRIHHVLYDVGGCRWLVELHEDEEGGDEQVEELRLLQVGWDFGQLLRALYELSYGVL